MNIFTRTSAQNSHPLFFRSLCPSNGSTSTSPSSWWQTLFYHTYAHLKLHDGCTQRSFLQLSRPIMSIQNRFTIKAPRSWIRNDRPNLYSRLDRPASWCISPSRWQEEFESTWANGSQRDTATRYRPRNKGAGVCAKGAKRRDIQSFHESVLLRYRTSFYLSHSTPILAWTNNLPPSQVSQS